MKLNTSGFLGVKVTTETKDKEKNSGRVSLKLPPLQRQLVDAEAKRHGLSRTAMILVALSQRYEALGAPNNTATPQPATATPPNAAAAAS